MKIEMQSTVDIDVKILAKLFASLTDDDQAQFFIEVAQVANEWPKTYGGPSYQWYLIGSHLRNCECSTEDAREMIRGIAEGVQIGTHGLEAAT